MIRQGLVPSIFVYCATFLIVYSEPTRQRELLPGTVNDSQPLSDDLVSGAQLISPVLGKASKGARGDVTQQLRQYFDRSSGSYRSQLEQRIKGDDDQTEGAPGLVSNRSKLPREGPSLPSGLKVGMGSQQVMHDIELNDPSKGSVVENDALHSSHPFYGVLLSVAAACLVGASFIFQKKALVKIELEKNKKSGIRKGHCGEFTYLKQWMWWCGMISMAVGEILNFVAYSIAPAILVTPLGALRVIVSAMLSSMFLGERLNVHGKIGILLSLVGSVMIIIHAPRHEKVKTFEDVIHHFTDKAFLLFCFVLILATLFLILYAGPRYGRTYVMVYISVCNIVGALCVLCGKGLGISLKELPEKGQLIYLHPMFWLLVLGNVVGILTQIVYLNKALAVFNASVITPIKYVFTNVFLVFGSILLLQEFEYMSVEDVIGINCGFVTVVTGVVLLNVSKDLDARAKL